MDYVNRRVADLARNVLFGKPIDRSDALFLIQLSGQDRYDLLYWANSIRNHYLGNKISFCSILSIKTGKCSEDCRFCAQSSYYQTTVNKEVADIPAILTAAENAVHNKAEFLGLVASGLAPSDREIDSLSEPISKIRNNKDLTCCAALGCLSESQAVKLYSMGIRRYNHNLETSERFFPQVVTTHRFADRINTVKNAQKAGLAICCGGIFGLGETLEDRVDLALQIRDLNVDCIPLNFLNPIPGTPFENNPPIPPLEALQTIAVFRFIHFDKQIKIAGGREKCLRDLQSWMFFAGASSTMIGNYLTTQGRKTEEDLQMFKDLEFLPDKSS